MESSKKVFVTFVVLILLLVGFYSLTQWLSSTTGYAVGESDQVKVGQCLSGMNTKLYFNQECQNCDKQREVLGEGFKFIQIIDCRFPESRCANVDQLTWQINGSIYYGFKDLAELKNISGC